MQTRRVQRGEPLKISAATWNDMLDALATWKRSAKAGVITDDGLPPQPCIVDVRNDSGSDRLQFEILGIGGVTILPTENTEEFRERHVIKGLTPTADHVNKFVVLQEDIPDGEIGRGIVCGVTPAMVDMDRAIDGFAKAKSGAYTLTSSTGGASRILYTDGTTASQTALINVGAGKASGDPDGLDPCCGCSPTDCYADVAYDPTPAGDCPGEFTADFGDYIHCCNQGLAGKQKLKHVAGSNYWETDPFECLELCPDECGSCIYKYSSTGRVQTGTARFVLGWPAGPVCTGGSPNGTYTYSSGTWTFADGASCPSGCFPPSSERIAFPTSPANGQTYKIWCVPDNAPSYRPDYDHNCPSGSYYDEPVDTSPPGGWAYHFDQTDGTVTFGSATTKEVPCYSEAEGGWSFFDGNCTCGSCTAPTGTGEENEFRTVSCSGPSEGTEVKWRLTIAGGGYSTTKLELVACGIAIIEYRLDADRVFCCKCNNRFTVLVPDCNWPCEGFPERVCVYPTTLDIPPCDAETTPVLKKHYMVTVGDVVAGALKSTGAVDACPVDLINGVHVLSLCGITSGYNITQGTLDNCGACNEQGLPDAAINNASRAIYHSPQQEVTGRLYNACDCSETPGEITTDEFFFGGTPEGVTINGFFLLDIRYCLNSCGVDVVLTWIEWPDGINPDTSEAYGGGCVSAANMAGPGGYSASNRVTYVARLDASSYPDWPAAGSPITLNRVRGFANGSTVCFPPADGNCVATCDWPATLTLEEVPDED